MSSQDALLFLLGLLAMVNPVGSAVLFTTTGRAFCDIDPAARRQAKRDGGAHRPILPGPAT